MQVNAVCINYIIYMRYALTAVCLCRKLLAANYTGNRFSRRSEKILTIISIARRAMKKLLDII